MKSYLLLTALAALPIGLLTPRPSAPSNNTGTNTGSSVAEYKVDTVHSSALFRIKHMGVSWFYGRFNKFEGSLTWDPAKPEASKLDFSIDPASVDTNSKDRDEHLCSPTFFSVKEFPNVTFKSTKVAKKGDKLEVTGELELHGVKKTLTVPVEHVGSGETEHGVRTGFEAIIDIKRSDFGISYGLPDSLGDDVRLIVSLEGLKG